MNTELVKIDTDKIAVPKNWDYKESVKIVKSFVYKWQSLTSEMLKELWIAREVLSQSPSDAANIMHGTKVPRTWSDYCLEIQTRSCPLGQKSHWFPVFLFLVQGLRDKSPEVKTWSDYCLEIGSDRRVVNRWLQRYSEKLLAKSEAELLPLPKGKYNIIYADPAWKYYEGGFKNQSQHYKTMELEDICNLPVGDLAADNCILFLWVTFPMLDNFMDVLRCWGFEYSTVGFVWIKSKDDKTGFAFGLGNWTRSNAEICIIAKRGSIERKDASISQIIYEPKGEHSEKPAIVRDKIVQLVGDLPRIELFARQKTEGWNVWGNEI